VIELQSDQKEVYRLWIDYQQREMVKMKVYGADQKLLLEAWFDNYETIDDYTWPKKIECNFTSSQIRFSVTIPTDNHYRKSGKLNGDDF